MAADVAACSFFVFLCLEGVEDHTSAMEDWTRVVVVAVEGEFATAAAPWFFCFFWVSSELSNSSRRLLDRTKEEDDDAFGVLVCSLLLLSGGDDMVSGLPNKQQKARKWTR